MPGALKFPATFKTDNEFVDIALAEFRQENGFHESIGLGDLDWQSQSAILDRAQRLKMKQREDVR